jgi:hypothetical protein
MLIGGVAWLCTIFTVLYGGPGGFIRVIANKKLSANKKVVTTFKLYEKDALFGLNIALTV